MQQKMTGFALTQAKAPLAPQAALPEIRNTRLYENVLLALRDFVLAGHLQPGEAFPSERVLEQQLRVSRPVLREAFRVLEMQGVVRTRQGGGRFLVNARFPSPDELRSERLANSAETLLALWDAREAVEVRAAELAAQNRSSDDLLAIERPVALIGMIPSGEYREADLNLEYHVAIAAASKNPYLKSIVLKLIDEFRELDFKHLVPPHEWDDLQGLHRAVYEAIKRQDVRGAGRAMKAHFDDLRQSVAHISVYKEANHA